MALAYQASGLVAALLTLVFPIVAEVSWIDIIWSETGVFWHELTVVSVAYLALCAVAMAAGGIAASGSD
jgi:hypothetical protein